MYNHNNSETLRSLLEEEVIRQRNTKNALTFFSQFCSFVAEFFLTIVFMIAIKKSNNDNPIFLVFFNVRWFTFSAIAMMEVATSNHLRQLLFNFIKG